MKSTFSMKSLLLVVCMCCLYHRGEFFGFNRKTTITTTPNPVTTSNYNTDDGCWRGKCTEAGKCISPDSRALEPTGSCGRKRGAWVCCLEEKSTNSIASDRSTASWFSSSSSTTPNVPRDHTSTTRSTNTKPNRGSNARSTTSVPSSDRYIHGGYWGSSRDYHSWGNDYYDKEVEDDFGHSFGGSSDAGPSVDDGWYDDDTNPYDLNNERGDWSNNRGSTSSSGSDGCKKGRCMKRNECNSWSSTVSQATGKCARRPGYDWVCCKEETRPSYSTSTRSSTSAYTTSTTTETPYWPNRGNTWKKTTRLPTVRTTSKPKETDGCIAGTCMKRENCTFSGSVALSATGLCARRRLGEWVCCHRNATDNDIWGGSGRTGNTDRGIHTTRFNPKKTTTTTATPSRRSYSGCGLREGFSGGSRTARSNYEMHPDTEYHGLADAVPESGILSRIVGGSEAEPYSWPWVAALFKESSPGMKRFLCAGSLINDRYILSAAHVFSPEDIEEGSFIVRLGTHTGSEHFGEFRVRKITIHPEYQHRYYYNDISLLELQEPVTFNHFVYPVCLPPSNAYCKDSEIMGKKVTVTGWGDESFGGKSSGVLKEATFPIVSRESCNASYVEVASSKFPKGITEKMLCAGAPAGGKDACQGDSGGPLVLKNGKQWIQVGVVSFGYRCGDSKFPGVYTKVGYYVDWIFQNANIKR